MSTPNGTSVYMGNGKQASVLIYTDGTSTTSETSFHDQGVWKRNSVQEYHGSSRTTFVSAGRQCVATSHYLWANGKFRVQPVQQITCD